MDKAYSLFCVCRPFNENEKIPHTYRLSISSTDKPVT